MYAYEPILRDLVRSARAAYARQVRDPRRPDDGAFLSLRDAAATPKQKTQEAKRAALLTQVLGARAASQASRTKPMQVGTSKAKAVAQTR